MKNPFIENFKLIDSLIKKYQIYTIPSLPLCLNHPGQIKKN